MKKFSYFIQYILPAIIAVCVTDDNTLVISYHQGKDTNQVAMTLTDYDLAVGNSKKMDGLLDRMNGLS